MVLSWGRKFHSSGVTLRMLVLTHLAMSFRVPQFDFYPPGCNDQGKQERKILDTSETHHNMWVSGYFPNFIVCVCQRLLSNQLSAGNGFCMICGKRTADLGVGGLHGEFLFFITKCNRAIS